MFCLANTSRIKALAFFEAARARGLEGIIAKNADSPYREGRRGPDWLKIKTGHRQEAVIGGFTEPRGQRKDIGALVLGVYEGNALRYIGHAGGGLDTEGLSDLRARLDPLVRRACPFQDRPRTNAPRYTGCSRNSFAKCAFRTGRRTG